MRGLPSDSGTRLQQAASYLREDALMTIPVIAAAIITGLIRRKPRISKRGGMRILRYH